MGAPSSALPAVPVPTGPVLQCGVPGDHADQPDLRDPAPLRVDTDDADHMAGECAPSTSFLCKLSDGGLSVCEGWETIRN